MKILLIAGHGQGDCGAIGFGCQEQDLTREVVSLVKPILSKFADVTVFDTSKNMYSFLKSGNTYDFKKYDYVLEIHFNACVKDFKGNGSTTGTEIYIHPTEQGQTVEEHILNNISKLGFKNRGVKKRSNLLNMNVCKGKQNVSYALLETCFIDDLDDFTLYQSYKKDIAQSIVNGIIKGFGLEEVQNPVKDFKSPQEITTELTKYITIYEKDNFIIALDKAQKENSPLYWGFYKIVNSFK